MLTILLDGIAYGMLLFVLSCGLSVTLGLMNFINLAHGAFAMAGGYGLSGGEEATGRSDQGLVRQCARAKAAIVVTEKRDTTGGT